MALHFDNQQARNERTAPWVSSLKLARQARTSEAEGMPKPEPIEVFDDSDGALTRVQNLMSSPIAPEWTDRFEIDSLTVLGDVSDDLQEALASMAPDVRTFAGGFTRT